MATITVNGKPYEIIQLGDFTLDEAMVLWEYSKLSMDQIADIEGFHPGVTAALIHIAVARVETGESQKTIRKVVGAIKMSELEQVFLDISEEVETLPPPSEPNATVKTSGSGETSSTTGGPAPEPSPPNGSGSPGSGTGAISDRRISVG